MLRSLWKIRMRLHATARSAKDLCNEIDHQDLHPSEQPPHRFVVGITAGVGQVLPEVIDERAHRFVAGFGTSQADVEGLGGLEVSSLGQNVLVRFLDPLGCACDSDCQLVVTSPETRGFGCLFNLKGKLG